MPGGTPIPAAERGRRYFSEGPRDQCWPWQGAIGDNGYGVLNLGGRPPVRQVAHRFVYELYNGPIPRELQLDHLCHTHSDVCVGGNTCIHRRCVNPAHLEPVEPGENTRRGAPARRARCPAGHPRDGAQRRGGKYCKACARERQMVVREERRQGVRPEPRLIECSDCARTVPLCARGLCRMCYTRWYRAQRHPTVRGHGGTGLAP